MSLPDDANKQVAVACGFEWSHEIDEDTGQPYLWATGNAGNQLWIGKFHPSTDPAAAMFALEAWCRKNKCAWQLNGIPSSGDHVECQTWNHRGVNHCANRKSLEEAICTMILEAEKAILAAEEART